MYDSDTLNELVTDYMNHCNCQPTKKGLASYLKTSTTTISNVCKGYYNHKPYGLIPHINRVIDTKDFGLVRSLFAKPHV